MWHGAFGDGGGCCRSIDADVANSRVVRPDVVDWVVDMEENIYFFLYLVAAGDHAFGKRGGSLGDEERTWEWESNEEIGEELF